MGPDLGDLPSSPAPPFSSQAPPRLGFLLKNGNNIIITSSYLPRALRVSRDERPIMVRRTPPR